MKKIVLAALLFAAVSSIDGAPLPQRQGQRNLPKALRPNVARRTLVEDGVYAFYVKQFQQDADFSPEVFAKILPHIDQFIQERFQISQRRTRILNAMRQSINRNAAEDELRRLVRELDAVDAEFQTNQEKFFSSVDPLLNVRQQAKVRVLQNMADNRIRQLLNAVQNPPPAPQD
jgi:hypothetical protein